jgi:amidase
MELWQLDATDLAHLIRTGRASAREAVISVLARVDAVNPKLNAIVRRLDDEALAAADAADAARARGDALGPLHGVPVTTKVNVDQKGLPNDNGVPAFRDVIAQHDAPVVANLRVAGAIIIGRTNTPSFSMRGFTNNKLHGRTLNPRDPAITPGGSSGGAGACSATGMGPIAHGNDIAGSVRVPAYCCGTVGLRVSLGRIPAFNLSAAAPRPIGAQLMAVQGPLTRTIRDCRLALAAMARGDDRDTRWVPAPLVGSPAPRPIRVALVPEVPGGFTHPAQAAAVRTAGRHLAAAGYAVEEVLPPDIAAIAACWHALGSNDVFRTLGQAIERHGDADTVTSYREWMAAHPPTDGNAALDALMERDGHLQRWLTFMRERPLVIMPTMCDLPPTQDQDLTSEGQARMLESLRVELVAPVLGLPALQVPVGSQGALRTGVQILAPRFREDLALDAGTVIEAVEGVVVPIDPAW